MTRPLGLYWVKLSERWTIAEWIGDQWLYRGPNGRRLACFDNGFDELGDIIVIQKELGLS